MLNLRIELTRTPLASFTVHVMFLFLFTFILLHGDSTAEMFLRQPSPTIDAVLICSLFPDFTPEQTNLCIKNPQVVAAISKGVNAALKECEFQFQDQRWNCSSTKAKSSFGQTRAVPGTKEAAFMSAIVAAGVAHAVTRECTKGNISSCSCDKTKEGKTSPSGYRWGGCSDDIAYGIDISNKFLAGASGSIQKKYELQNRHNSNAGREVIRNSLKTDCRCNGVSGSCASKTCWKSLSLFRHIGNILKKKYNSAIKVRTEEVNSRIGKFPKFLVLPGTNFGKSPPHELVYLNKPQNYCEPIPELGVPGTSGRKCNHFTKESNGCEHLCCGRGYNKMEFIEDVYCNCRFLWCCRVICKTCKKKSLATICK